jgi:hypothetical protein
MSLINLKEIQEVITEHCLGNPTSPEFLMPREQYDVEIYDNVSEGECGEGVGIP